MRSDICTEMSWSVEAQRRRAAGIAERLPVRAEQLPASVSPLNRARACRALFYRLTFVQPLPAGHGSATGENPLAIGS